MHKNRAAFLTAKQARSELTLTQYVEYLREEISKLRTELKLVEKVQAASLRQMTRKKQR
jgi:hypothetical protein